MIDRRTFLAGTDAVLLAAPLAVEAQQAEKVPRIGFLSSQSSTDLAHQLEAFRRSIGATGPWVRDSAGPTVETRRCGGAVVTCLFSIDRRHADLDTASSGGIPVSHIRKVGMVLLVAALGLTSCAGQSDEERCKAGGGVWKQNSCENSSR